jgi:hypothetical protein
MMVTDTLSDVRVTYGRYEEKRVSDYLASTDTVKGVDPSAIYEPDGTPNTEAYNMMVAAQHVLAKDWDRPEEDEAWVYLSMGK